MTYITPNDSILRSSNLQTSICTLNTAQRGNAPMPIAQRKTYAPPFVSNSNEFSPVHAGRFYYFFNLISIQKVCAVAVMISLICNLFAGYMILTDDLCINNGSLFGQQFFYNFSLILPIIAHYNAIQGIRNRKIYQLIIFLIYCIAEILTAIGVNTYISFNVFQGTHCKMHIVLAGSLLGTLAYFQLVTLYFVYENICFINRHINMKKSKKQQKAATKLNTLHNSRIASNIDTIQFSVDPSESIQDTLQQVIRTWEYQRDRRRKSKVLTAVKFEEGDNLLNEEEDAEKMSLNEINQN